MSTGAALFAAPVPTSQSDARLEFLEALLEEHEVAGCARRGVEWATTHTPARRAILLIADARRAGFVGVAASGVPLEAPHDLFVDPGDRRDPLAATLLRRRVSFFRGGEFAPRSRTAEALFAHASHVAVPISRSQTAAGAPFGLLLLSPARPPLKSDIRWLASVLGSKLDQLAMRGSLAEDERRFRRERSLLFSVINAVSDPILLTDPEGRLVVANTPAEALFAVADDMSEGRRRAVELNNMFFSAALSRTAIQGTFEARRELLLVDPSDGSDRLFELLSTIVEDPREGSGVVSVLRNVTDLRRATQQIEENYSRIRAAEAAVRAERDRLNLIIDSVADPILATDAEGNITLMNTPAERLFTLPLESGEVDQRIVRANDAHFSSFISGLLSTGTDVTRRGDIALAEPGTGKTIPVEALAGKILSELGELTAVVTILHDRTEALERAALYEQLKKASDELEAKVHAATAELARQNERLRRQAIDLEQASAAKSQFLANVSHELRTPLNAILGYATMTLEGIQGALTPAQRKSIARIQANGRHLLNVINEILDITRIQAGRMPVALTEFDLPGLVREVVTELEPLVARSKLQVTTRVGACPRLRTDRQKVKQILVNLLSNAIKFTHEGGVTLKATHLASTREVEIAVTDTGIGIAAADLERVFDDFQQLDSTSTRAYGGTGLGLAICRRLAAILRGGITVQSEPGHGSTFTLVIPLRLRR
jgi:PAS domain S-box-containing protein